MSQRSQVVVESLSALINQQPFFAVLAFNLTDIVDSNLPDGINTCATDGKRIFINPAYFKTLTVSERVFCIAHEIMHIILEHPQRMKGYIDMGFGPDLKKLDQKRFTHAADYVINDYLNKMKIGKQPLNTLLNGQYGMDDLVDDVYCKLPETPEDQQDNGGGFDQHMPAAPDATDQSVRKAEVQRAVREAETAQKMMGDMPAGMKQLIDSICEPQVSWQDHIQRSILSVYGNDEATWSKLHRRKLATPPHIPFPGRAGTRAGKVFVTLDTSGSIGQTELDVFMGEVRGVLESVMPETVYLAYIDARLFDLVEFDDVSDLAAVADRAGGGGGTDMTVTFGVIEERQLDVECALILTDGYTPFGEDPGYPVIWCITTPEITAPFGETVHVKL